MPDGTPELKEQLREQLSIHKGLIDLTDEHVNLRRRLGDYKDRMDDLHAQIRLHAVMHRRSRVRRDCWISDVSVSRALSESQRL